MKQTETDEIYSNIPLKEIPWNIENPPDALIQLIESGKIKPCTVIDLGCGAGNYAVYLAGKGFTVTGVDISESAIKYAKKNAKDKKVRCDFLRADVLGDLEKEVDKTYDFAYDWELLHHIYPENRNKYLENMQCLINPGGRYLSVCFNEKDGQFGGSGKYRKTQLGTILYFSSEDELRKLFSLYFDILEIKTFEIRGKTALHIVTYVLMEKRTEK
ncbi:MAG: class I SAM-dependent methyltransferase [Lentimicrobiaceae bacterium]|jgi:2-polyprenyl-3-methyl-5-hydroxy-6-metoxy-1,4-benzoquinol methylase